MTHRRQVVAAIVASLISFTTGVCLTWPSVALYKWQTKEYKLPFAVDYHSISWIVAMMDFGNIFSPIPAGYLLDWIGRKNTLLMTAVLFILSSVLTVLAQSTAWLLLARLFAGLGKGVVFTGVPMYIAEISDSHIRGSLITIFTASLKLGALLTLSVGPYIPYQALNIILGIIPLIFCVSFIFIPDTPYSHIVKNNNQAASRKSLQWFHGGENIEDQLKEIVTSTNENMQNKTTYTELVMSPFNRKALKIVLVLCLLQRLGGISSILAYASTTLPKSSTFIGRRECLVIFSMVLVVTNIASSPLMDIKGRKVMNAVSAGLCSADMFVMTAAFLWKWNFWVSYLMTVLFGAFYSLGVATVPVTLTSEMFPANVKSKAAAIATMSFAVGSFIANKSYKMIQVNFGVHWMFLFFALCSAGNVVFTMFYVIETKGKSFQEIQEILKGDSGRR